VSARGVLSLFSRGRGGTTARGLSAYSVCNHCEQEKDRKKKGTLETKEQILSLSLSFVRFFSSFLFPLSLDCLVMVYSEREKGETMEQKDEN
jgi:hypothetical protein